MALTSDTRIQLRTDITDTMQKAPNEWDANRIQILLEEFIPDYTGDAGCLDVPTGIQHLLRPLPDECLQAMHKHVTRNLPAEVERSKPWIPGHHRMFISHAHEKKTLAQNISSQMKIFEVDSFVAHESIEPGEDWEKEIRAALDSMQSMLYLSDKNASESPWCQQELGWATARQVPVLPISIGAEVAGFPSKIQWQEETNARGIVVGSVKWLFRNESPESGHIDRLLRYLESSRSFDDTICISQVLVVETGWSVEDLAKLRDIWRANDQVRNCVGARRLYDKLASDYGFALPTSAT